MVAMVVGLREEEEEDCAFIKEHDDHRGKKTERFLGRRRWGEEVIIILFAKPEKLCVFGR